MDNKITMGLKETKEAIDCALAFGMSIDKSLADGKVTLTDIPFFFPSFVLLLPAVEGADQIALEFKLASQEELDELKAYVNSKLDLRDDQVEQFIEDAFGLVLTIWSLVKTYFLKPTPGTEASDEATISGAPIAE